MSDTLGAILRRSFSIGRPTLVAGLILAACSTTDTLPNYQSAQSYDGATMVVATPEAAVLSAGISRIAEVYFRPLNLSEVTVEGLNALSEFDPRLDFSIQQGVLRIDHAGQTAKILALPEDQRADNWAQLATLALDAARIQSTQLAAVEREALLEAMFTGMTARLDRFSRYASARKGSRERHIREGFGGVGLAFEHSDDAFVIRSVFPDGPAYHAGLQAGDLIRSIDGHSTASMDLTQVRDQLRGRVGSFVMVDVERDGELVEDFSLLRERVITNTVIGRMEDGIGIVTIERFNAATEAHVRAAVSVIHQRLGDNFRGLVLDLRGNPGGLLEQAVAVSDLFIKRGRIIRTAGRHPESFQDFAADTLDILDGAPMVVLVNGGSASAAEVVAAALQETGRAVVVGSASYGKGSVQTVTRLPNDGELFVTWSEIFTPDGHGLHEIGILPNICTSLGDWEQAKPALETQISNRAKPTPSIWRNHINLQDHASIDWGTMDHAMVAEIAADGRKDCPPSTKDTADDQEIAKLLIGKPDLIAQISGDASVFAAASSSPISASLATSLNDLR
ncbi:MAG: PDZ domain-containing protein [Alphaproteobacteria bacterium]|nr:PDZ domain-containing protein [Alphaproteobacteria bacterium SS10]